jgi:hypothetical protein
VKEIIFHPEARAEMREAVEFYEARLDDSVSDFGRPSSRRRNGFPTNQRRARRLVVNSVSGSFLVFPTTSFIVFGKITSTSLRSLTNTVGRAIGATDLAVANIGLRRRSALLSLQR